MKKQIFILNGMARCGKDTFAELLNEIYPTVKYSSIDRVKQIALECGWDGGKTDKDRKFLSDLKRLLIDYNDLPFLDVDKRITEFLNDESNVIMLIDIREPEEIKRAKDTYGAKTILVENRNIPFIDTNMSDASVFEYEYDHIVPNNGSLEDLRAYVRRFAEQYLK